MRYNTIKELYGTSTNQSVIVLDLKDATFLTNSIEMMDILKHVSNISDKHYPGNTSQIYVLNMPSIIKNTWDLLKIAFPSRLTALVTILDKNYL